MRVWGQIVVLFATGIVEITFQIFVPHGNSLLEFVVLVGGLLAGFLLGLFIVVTLASTRLTRQFHWKFEERPYPGAGDRQLLLWSKCHHELSDIDWIVEDPLGVKYVTRSQEGSGKPQLFYEKTAASIAYPRDFAAGAHLISGKYKTRVTASLGTSEKRYTVGRGRWSYSLPGDVTRAL